MFNLGFTELFALAVIALLVIGPKQLPEMARSLARLMNELKRATNHIMEPMENIKSEMHKTTKSIAEFKDDLFEDKSEDHPPMEDNCEFSGATVVPPKEPVLSTEKTTEVAEKSTNTKNDGSQS